MFSCETQTLEKLWRRVPGFTVESSLKTASHTDTECRSVSGLFNNHPTEDVPSFYKSCSSVTYSNITVMRWCGRG